MNNKKKNKIQKIHQKCLQINPNVLMKKNKEKMNELNKY